MAINFLNTVAVDDSVLFVDTINDRVGIGTDSPGAKLEVDGDIGIGRVAGGYTFREVVGGGERASMKSNATNELIFSYGASSEAMRIDDSGNVGIGKTNPSYNLDVSGDIRSTGATRINTNAHIGGFIDVTGIINHRSNLRVLNKAATNWITWATRDTSGSESVINLSNIKDITATGNVGIGTTSPDAKLSVVGETSTNNLIGGSINLATSYGWTIPSGTFTQRVGYYGGDFTLNGVSAENSMEWGLGPFKDRQLLWTTIGSTDSNSDGGWNKTLTNLDIDSAYLSVVYFKRTSSETSGNLYHGTGKGANQITNLDGTANTNPYFVALPLSGFDKNVWYASVGIVQSNSDSNTTAYTDISGLYRLDTGAKISNTNTFKFGTAGATLTSGHRTYLFYSTNVNVVVQFANPGFYKIDGNQPKLHDILGDNDDAFWSVDGDDIYNDNSGNVGIGTTSPASKLDIVGSGLSTMLRLSNTEADTTIKYGAILGRHYTNAEENITGMLITSSSSATGGVVSIGGGISAANATNNVIFYTAANNTTLAGSERMRITPTGNVGIGTASPSSKLEVNGDIDTTGSNGYLINGMAWALENSGVLTLGDWDGNDFPTRIMDNNSSEVLRVTDGKVGIGTTNPSVKLEVAGRIQSSNEGLQIDTGGYGDIRIRPYYGAFLLSSSLYVGGASGYSYRPVYASAFNVNSDYRLKTNVVDLEEAIERVKQINVHRFNWKDRLDEEKVDGFLAHELAEVIPEAVTGEKDAVREDGTLDYQGVDQAKVVPLLTAALQEAISKIEQLETRIQTLENN